MARQSLREPHQQTFATAAISLVFLILAAPVGAIQFSPIEMSFTPAGRESVRTFRLENDTDGPVAVEISMFGRGMTTDGFDELIPAEDEFVVVPEQVVLGAGEIQWIRVQWIGNPDLKKEMAFRLIAEQLPIDIGEQPEVQGGVIRLLVRYLASVYVVPKGAKPEISVISAAETRGPDQTPRLLLELRNTGKAHKVLDSVRLVIKNQDTGDVASVLLSAEQLTELGGRNILADTTRQFVFDWPRGLPIGPIDVDIELPAP